MPGQRNMADIMLVAILFSSLSLAAPPVVSSSDAKCPDSNGARINTSNGTYIVECGIDRKDDDFAAVFTSSYGECVDLCASTRDCLQVSYNPGNPGSCYLKSGHGFANIDSTIWGAKQDDGTSSKISTCPESDGTQYRAFGNIFQVECGVDRRGGDIGPQIYTNFVGCIEACGAHPDCVDVTLSGAACYLKNNLTTPVFDPTFWGAQIIGTYDKQATQVSTTFVAPLPTASGSRCPDQNGTIVTRSCGSRYQVECDVDRFGNDLHVGPYDVYSLDSCIDKCDKTTGCKDISWQPGNPGPCYLKSVAGTSYQPFDGRTIWAARQLNGCSTTLVPQTVQASPTATVTSTAN
ncbi:hypothetical protein BDV96DRAFT_636555 [Lophiotrema nucula]|uniref:Apple domain-containing protein n=1 Tax=Lophiotrema nucula TaxID=690887 RepID=A0A6A5YQ86_9PLEO|nr:hypothetical protein BDV96DRAFT_636555 [Lophiotrema nucula]